MRAGTLPPLVVTGASGFVGRRLVVALRDRAMGAAGVAAASAPREVTLVVRAPASLAPLGVLPSHWRIVRADLSAGPLPSGAIPQGSVIVHLAAATGRITPTALRAVNVEGTRRLAEGARAAGALHLIFVSSIAASFANRRWYHYAEAKLAGERVVAECGVPFTIVRPTMVFGSGSPVQEGLERIATGGVPLVPGRGAVHVQPIVVDDLVDFLVALAEAPPPSGATVEVGGGERCTMRELLARMRAARGLGPRTPWSVPLTPVRLALALAESVLGPRLPVTAGQLASFVNDSVAAPNELVRLRLPHPRPLTAELSGPEAAPHVPSTTDAPSAVAPTERALSAEFDVFARYLGTASPGGRATAAYVAAHPSVGAAGDAFDAWLVAVARRSTLGCGLAEAYARLVRPRGLLRRKLVLALAVLESSAGAHAAYDSALPSSVFAACMAMAALGTGWVLRMACAVVLFVPVHLTVRVMGQGARDG